MIAPALKKACTGIAMGGVGSDIAVDAADIVLINDDFREFGHLLELSGQMMQTIRKNIIFSLVLNFTAIVLAVTGILSPVAGALVHNAGSVAVIISSALLLKWRCIIPAAANRTKNLCIVPYNKYIRQNKNAEHFLFSVLLLFVP